jgi:four helix bundle protein
MASIKRFEELESWKLSRKLVARFYKESGSGSISKDFALVDQMRRSSISIMSNLAEGFERNGNREFIHFCHIAKASAGEFRAQLYIAFDVGYFSEELFNELLFMVMQISKSIAGMIKYLESSELKGSKFSEPDDQYLSEPILGAAAY